MSSHFGEAPKILYVVDRSGCCSRILLFHTIFVPTFEESKGILTLGVVFSFSQVIFIHSSVFDGN